MLPVGSMSAENLFELFFKAPVLLPGNHVILIKIIETLRIITSASAVSCAFKVSLFLQ